jgi:uncharacterized membrane protein YoaK (UPF0700 family)
MARDPLVIGKLLAIICGQGMKTVYKRHYTNMAGSLWLMLGIIFILRRS